METVWEPYKPLTVAELDEIEAQLVMAEQCGKRAKRFTLRFGSFREMLDFYFGKRDV